MTLAVGLDIGSVATKAVALRDGAIVGRADLRSGAAHQAVAGEALRLVLETAGASRAEVGRVIATGYGRRAIDLADDVITEITAAARGAVEVGCPWGSPRLIVDLGGQDTKVILLDEDGLVRDFVMNDRCAAGTGRFLEVMADLLEVPVDRLGELDETADHREPVNATCTVFAESEVISLIADGAERADIVAGLHHAIAARIAGMARPMGEHDLCFIGGGALNGGVRRALERIIGRTVYVPPSPQHVVALGAALTRPRRE